MTGPLISHPKIKRKKIKIKGDSSRVITRPYVPQDEQHALRIIQRILALSDTIAEDLLAKIMLDFSKRHRDIIRVFERHLNAVKEYIPSEAMLSETKRTLIGAYFTMEYSVESAALFNPSVVPHPDQRDLAKGSLRFIMSLRATGEGHVSSIVFRSGVLLGNNALLFDPISDYIEASNIHVNPVYNRHLFNLKLIEMDASNEITDYLLNILPEEFTYIQLKESITNLHSNPRFSDVLQNEAFQIIYWLADSNYEINFKSVHRISERIIFPVSKNESNGIEDARFVQFLMITAK